MHFSSPTNGDSPTGGMRVPALVSGGVHGSKKVPGHGNFPSARLSFGPPLERPLAALQASGWSRVSMMSKLISIHPGTQLPVKPSSKQSIELSHTAPVLSQRGLPLM